MTSEASKIGRTPRWVLPVVIAICAAGAGVSGTLLWLQGRPTTAKVSLSNPLSTEAVNPAGTGAASAVPPSDQARTEPPAALTAGKTSAQAALALANWHFDHKAWRQAIQEYQQAVRLGQDNPDVRTDLGSAYRFAGDPRQALEQYRVAQKQNPGHENSLFNQGGVYAFALKQPDQAVTVWRAYLKQFPQGVNVPQARRLIHEVQAKRPKLNAAS